MSLAMNLASELQLLKPKKKCDNLKSMAYLSGTGLPALLASRRKAFP